MKIRELNDLEIARKAKLNAFQFLRDKNPNYWIEINKIYRNNLYICYTLYFKDDYKDLVLIDLEEFEPFISYSKED